MEIADRAEAEALARRYARGMAAESVREGHLDQSHYIRVSNENGDTVFTVKFGDVINIVS